ncbi:MAG: hypothetical protein IPK91_13210 [Saprospiraceae bacterium]|nr:hypothetical protein [Saprospiraceae bacterium]MBK8298204.1 hypothetical protein [Saprospiraceae bacterium]
MTRTKLINSISELIQHINDQELLQLLYYMHIRHSSAKSGELWNSISPEQKEEVLKAYEESKNDENLIPVENIFKNK